MLICALVALAGLFAPPVALGHAIGPNYETVARSLMPETPGLSVAVIKKLGQLKLVNRSAKRVVVYGYEHDPYAKLEPDGRVYVNVRSPATYLNTDIYANVDVPSSASATAKPKWVLKRTDHTFQWHDHRIHWMSPEPPAKVSDLNAKTKIFDWRTPLMVGERRGEILGTLYWAGSPKAPPLGSIIVFSLSGLAVLIGGAIWFRRMKGDDTGPSEQKSGSAEPEKEAW